MNNEKIQNLKCITSKETESVIKNLPTEKSQGPNRFNHPQEMLAHRIHNTLKEVYTMITWGLTMECKDDSTHKNQSILHIDRMKKTTDHLY